MAKAAALILAGAVSKGAFEAGVLSVLAAHSETIPIRRVVGASSGALNGAVYAAGIRVGAERAAAAALEQLWEESASLHNAVKLDLRDLLELRGVGTADRILPLMRRAVTGLPSGEPRAVELCILLARLAGSIGQIAHEPATTYEYVDRFSEADFSNEAGLERVFQAALGSAAFPVLFAPVDVPGVGFCADGGAVNNTPIRVALGESDIERIIVVTAQPRVANHDDAEPTGIALVSLLADMLVNERLYRDLRTAEGVNETLRKLAALAKDPASSVVIEQVRALLGWKPLEIVQIRPELPLAGSAFHGFIDAQARREYVAAGRAAAEAALAALPPAV